MIERIKKKIKKFHISNKNNKYLAIVDRGNVDAAFRQLIAGNILSKKKGLNIIVLTDLENSSSHKLFHTFGVKKIIKFSEYFKKNKYNLKIWSSFFLNFFPFCFFYLKDKNNYLLKFIKTFSFRKVIIGDILYDTYIRYKLNFLKFRKLNFNFIVDIFKNLFIIICRFYWFEEIYSKHDIKVSLVSAKGYISSGNLLRRYCSYNNKKILFLSGNFFKIMGSKKLCHRTVHKLENKEYKEFSKNLKNNNINHYYNNKFYKLKFTSKSPYVPNATFISAYKNTNLNKNTFVNIFIFMWVAITVLTVAWVIQKNL